jgi:hypothetical protein
LGGIAPGLLGRVAPRLLWGVSLLAIRLAGRWIARLLLVGHPTRGSLGVASLSPVWIWHRNLTGLSISWSRGLAIPPWLLIPTLGRVAPLRGISPRGPTTIRRSVTHASLTEMELTTQELL